MKIGRIKQDLALEREGVWARYPGTDFECRLARVGNPEFQSRRQEILEGARIAEAVRGELSERETRDAIAPIVARHIVLDWRGLEDDDGSEIQHSVARCEEMLRDPHLNDWYTWVLRVAGDAQQFRRKAVESEGNA